MENTSIIDTSTKAKIFDIARGYASLFATLVALFMVIVAPIELNEVKNAKEYARIDAVFTGAQYKISSFRRSTQYLSFGFRAQSGKDVEVIDLQPGDFPFSADFFGLKFFDTNRFAAQKLEIGRHYQIIRHDDGRKYYLGGGNYFTMLIFLSASILWLGYVGFHIFKKRN